MGKRIRLVPALAVLTAAIIFLAGCNTDNTGGPSITGSPESTTSGIASTTITQSIRIVSVSEAYQMIQQNQDNNNFMIIDVRTPEEYAEGHIEGATLINYNDADFSAKVSKLDRNTEYLIYCRTARRSALAADIFKELGFTNVADMAGGITDWISQGYPVVN